MAQDIYTEHYGQLVGKTVKKVVKEYGSFGRETPLYGLQFTDGTVAWIIQDPEGNGPGHLDILGMPVKEG